MGQLPSTLVRGLPQNETQLHDSPSQRPPVVVKALQLENQTRCHLFMLVVDLKARDLWWASSTSEYSALVCDLWRDRLDDARQGLYHLLDVLLGGGRGVPGGETFSLQLCPTLPSISSSMSHPEATSFGKQCTALQQKIDMLDTQQYRAAMLIQRGSGNVKFLADSQSAQRLQCDPLWQQLHSAMHRKATPVVNQPATRTAHAPAPGGVTLIIPVR
jgi:hypothetical protein